MSKYATLLASSINPGTLGILGGLSFAIISLSLMFTVEQIINEIFRCRHNRSVFKRVMISLILIILAPSTLGFSVYYAGRLLFYMPGTWILLLPFLFTAVTLYMGYWLLPHRHIKKRYAFISAIFVAIVMEITKLGFALYAKYIGFTLSYVYGTMAMVPLFMAWIYVAWLMFLFGAELNAALHEVKKYDQFK
jgi:membrane protein